VFIALARMGFLPRLLEKRNRWRGTPHWSILASIAVPIILVATTGGQAAVLGDLYAFGLLGAFILTCLALDVVRWHERHLHRGLRARVGFWLGVLTTALVIVAWTTNLFAKPLATEFGGGLTLVGLAIGLLTYHYSRSRVPVVFPFQHRADRTIIPIAGGRRLMPCQILAILPHDPEAAEAVVAAAVHDAGPDRTLVFLYQGDPPPEHRSELLEVADPYLKDRAAQVAFGRAERMARKSVRDRQFVYVPGHFRRETVGDVWKRLSPAATLVVDGQQDVLPPVAVDRVRRTHVDGIPVLRLVSRRPPKAAQTAGA
jgi:hypothetical protein